MNCKNCGNESFEAVCGVHASCLFDVEIVDNTIRLGEYQETTDLEPRNIIPDSTFIRCVECGEEVADEQLEKMDKDF